jgi:NNP family nitrate/nitrite transporter-like MFS transporter
LGGRLADRSGGAKITMACFVAMVLAAGVLVVAGTRGDAHPGKISHGTMVAYVVGFILLFLISGIGNGSVYKMIPAIFAAKSLDLKNVSAVETLNWERSMAGALIGIAGAVGALGGVGINVVLRASYAGAQKSATTAFWVFLVFYIVCVGVTWAAYVRPRGATSLV